jgi:tetratricopeptide (TPR) repeat protein
MDQTDDRSRLPAADAPRWMRWWLVALCALAIPVAPALSAAQSTPADLSDTQKRKYLGLLQQANEAYGNGEFRTAADLLLEAKEILYNPAIDYRVARCYEQLGELQKAITHYETFLEKKPDTKRRKVIESNLQTLRQRVQATLQIESRPGGATVSIKGKGQVGTTPAKLTVKPGTYTVSLSKQNYETRTEKVELTSGGQHQLDWSLTEAGSSAVEPPVPQASGTDGGGHLPLLIAGGVTLAASGVTTGLFAHNYSKFKDSKENSPDYERTKHEDYTDRANGFGATAIATGVIGAGLLTWGLVKMGQSVEETASSRPTTPKIGVRLGRQGAGVSVSGSF